MIACILQTSNTPWNISRTPCTNALFPLQIRYTTHHMIRYNRSLRYLACNKLLHPESVHLSNILRFLSCRTSKWAASRGWYDDHSHTHTLHDGFHPLSSLSLVNFAKFSAEDTIHVTASFTQGLDPTSRIASIIHSKEEFLRIYNHGTGNGKVDCGDW